MIFQLLVFVYFVTTAFSSPIDPHLVCEGKRWESILTFFITNYIAHAFTVVPDPGANWIAQIVFGFTALMVPNIGLIGAIDSVMSYFLQGRSDDLHRALAQDALFILVKRDNLRAGDREIDIKFVIKAFWLNFVYTDVICIRTNKKLNSRQVHGKITIPDGYALIVPSQRQHLEEMKPALRESEGIKLYRSKELTSAAVGIVQIIFASITIYRARGDQIEKYGYAAYGFSVYPYLLMSLANLIKLLICGRYPYAYVLRTATLAEAEKDGGVFEGAVGNPREDGRAVDDSQGGGSMGLSDPPFWIKSGPLRFEHAGYYKGYWWIVPTIDGLILLIAILSQPLFVFLLSGFNARNTQGQKILTPKAGQSTRAQRIWMLGWLGVNMDSCIAAYFIASGRRRWRGRGAERERGSESWDERGSERGSERGDERFNWVIWADFLIDYLFFFLAYVFAFGGFVTVGGMLHAEISYQPC